MAYNNGRENRKWLRWKEAEEKVLRECGVDEDTIGQLRTYDRALFNSDRRFYEKLQDVGSYLETVAESGEQIDIKTVEDFLDSIEDKNLYHALLATDRRTLQILLMKIQGYSTKEIAAIVHLTPKAIYGRMHTLRKKLKQFKQ